jgi:TonB-dependent Receptor Plug Domain/Gram-negative bacterial TonB protein C-terminal
VLSPILALPVGFAQAASAPVPPALEPPRLLTEMNVPYPAEAIGAAEVLLTVTVNDDGTVRSAVAAETNEPFSGVAVRAALGWRYQPASRGGRAVAARIRVQIVFRPPESSAPAPASALAPAPASASDGVTEVIVRGAHEEPSRTASLTRAEVRQIPGVFGDPFRAIEIMPGVTPIISGLPFFYIRGAPPGDVGYYLDGVRVPYLFHVGVGPSVIHPALVDRVDLYPGGYPARFGRFAGGIVDGETVPPADELHGEYNLRPFDAGAIAETPFDGGRGTLLLGGRYSYTGLLLSIFSPNTVLSYWDYQARATYALTPRDRVGVFVFGADDFLGQKASGTTQTLFGTQFHRADVRYDHRLSEDGTLRTAITFGEDLTDVGNGQSVRDRLTGARTELAYRLSPGALLRTGVDAEADKYDVVVPEGTLGPSETALAANYFPSRTDIAAGVRADAVLTVQRGLEVTPGARLDFFGSQGTTAVAVDPRLAARVTMTRRSHLLWALGIAHQPPAFAIPVPGFQPGGLKGGLQTAAQESAGVEWELGNATTATATVFHNGFFNMSDALGVMQTQPEGCQPGTFPTDTLPGDPGGLPRTNMCGNRFLPGTVGTDRSGGGGQNAEGSDTTTTIQAIEARTNGTAYGLELFIKRKLTERFGGFLSYTLSRSTRTYGNQDFLAAFDRTHVLNVAAAYDLGRNWRAGARVVFYTGLPKAPDPTDPGTRLAPFFRLDVRLEKRWQLGRKTWLSLVAEWMNVTFSKEEIGTSCTLQGCQATTVGPITIPSLGIEGGF